MWRGDVARYTARSLTALTGTHLLIANDELSFYRNMWTIVFDS